MVGAGTYFVHSPLVVEQIEADELVGAVHGGLGTRLVAQPATRQAETRGHLFAELFNIPAGQALRRQGFPD